MGKKLLVAFLGIIFAVAGLAGCKAEVESRPLEMKWGIPGEVRGFEGLEREPEGAELELVNEDTLKVSWHAGESYILPISATADKELDGVRYRGRGIPAYLEVEWLDPFERRWYPLGEIPEEKIRAQIKEEDGLLSIDFGPPEGADFKEGTTRVIWFRITPTEPDEFEFEIFGYLPGEKDPLLNRVSNILTLKAGVSEERVRS